MFKTTEQPHSGWMGSDHGGRTRPIKAEVHTGNASFHLRSLGNYTKDHSVAVYPGKSNKYRPRCSFSR